METTTPLLGKTQASRSISTQQYVVALPNRIGDAILTLPALLALKQLQEAFPDTGPPFELTLYCNKTLHPLFHALDLFPVQRLTMGKKIASWFVSPPDKAFLLYTSYATLGWRFKESYGLKMAHKPGLGWTHNLPCLCLEETETHLPTELVAYLRDQYGLSRASMRYFSIGLALGYTVAQIQNTFYWDFTALTLNLGKLSTNQKVTLPGQFLVISLESAYGSARSANRRLLPEVYFELAEQTYQAFQLPSVFIGLEKMPPLPNKPYFIDARQNLALMNVAALIHQGIAYMGNDSGLLHLANLLKKPTVGLYPATTPEDYGPVFPQFNTSIRTPQSAEDVWPGLSELLTKIQPVG